MAASGGCGTRPGLQYRPDGSGGRVPGGRPGPFRGSSVRHTVAVFVILSSVGHAAAEDYPHVFLKNDKLKVKVYLPDAEKGFYRGTRFDHAGVFGEIVFAEHKLFGPWKDKHDPTNHDDIVGPCEEFGNQQPLGYDEAKVGGTF